MKTLTLALFSLLFPLAALAKKFALGGAILNRDYSCLPEPARIRFFSDAQPPLLYVKYAPRKGQQIHQQAFDLTQLAVRSPKTRGKQLTAKVIASVTAQKPRNWDDKASPRGTLL